MCFKVTILSVRDIKTKHPVSIKLKLGEQIEQNTIKRMSTENEDKWKWNEQFIYNSWSKDETLVMTVLEYYQLEPKEKERIIGKVTLERRRLDKKKGITAGKYSIKLEEGIEPLPPIKHMFRPDDLGFTMHKKKNDIKQVASSGQAKDKGVCTGWSIIALGGKLLSEEEYNSGKAIRKLLKNLKLQAKPFEIQFTKVPRIALKIEDEEKQRIWEEGKEGQEVLAKQQAEKKLRRQRYVSQKKKEEQQQKINEAKLDADEKEDRYYFRIRLHRIYGAQNDTLFLYIQLGKFNRKVEIKKNENGDSRHTCNIKIKKTTWKPEDQLCITLWKSKAQKNQLGHILLKKPNKDIEKTLIPFQTQVGGSDILPSPKIGKVKTELTMTLDSTTNSITNTTVITSTITVPTISESPKLPHTDNQSTTATTTTTTAVTDGSGKDLQEYNDEGSVEITKIQEKKVAVSIKKSTISINYLAMEMDIMKFIDRKSLAYQLLGRKTISGKNWLPPEISKDDFDYMCIIGSGGFGKVFRVRYKPKKDNINCPQFAMKLINKNEVVQDNDIRSEIKIMKELIRHPFVVKIQGHFEDDTHITILMELVTGGSLEQVIKHWKKEKLTEHVATTREGMVKFWAGEIVMALDQMHKANIVYRDLKPDNVLLDECYHIRLCDLGVSFKMKSIGGDGDQIQTQCPTLEIGARGYKAPEMIKEGGYGYAVDWWSLGILMYYLLELKHPFGTGLFVDRDKKVCKVKSNFIKKIKHASDEANDVIQKLLIPDPGARLGGGFKDAAEVMEAKFFKMDKKDWKRLLDYRISKRRIIPEIEDFKTMNILANQTPEFENLDSALAQVDRQDLALQMELQAGIQ